MMVLEYGKGRHGILTNQMYIGNMVQNTHNKISYNSKKLRKTSKDELIIVEGTHEGIISKETFDKVQEIINNKSTTWVTDHQLDYLLGGMLYCYECGRTIRISEDVLKSGVRYYTQCNLYTRKGKYEICSSHRINYDWLEEDVIEYLQDVCEKFCKYYDFNEKKFSENFLFHVGCTPEIYSMNLYYFPQSKEYIFSCYDHSHYLNFRKLNNDFDLIHTNLTYEDQKYFGCYNYLSFSIFYLLNIKQYITR